MLAFLPAELKRGVDIVIETVQLAERVKGADLVITGEGRIDGQTVFGKTPIGVAKTAKRFGVPVIGIAGSLGDDSTAVLDHGIDALFTIVPGVVPLEQALEQAERYVTQTARHIASVYRLGQIGKTSSL